VKVVYTILAVALMLPLLFLVGIALGPAILVILLVIVWAVPVLLLEGARERHKHRIQIRPVHR
jgi:hypothetical protein